MNSKKIVALVFSFMLCSTSVVTPQVADVISNYVVASADTTGSCGDNVTYSFDSSTGTLTISGTGNMTTYESFDNAPWYLFREDIKKVIINYGITSISENAFKHCTALKDITIPNSVTSIGGSAFYNCPSLTSITIPDSVTYISDMVFDSCTSLTSITISDSVTSIGNYVFSNCTNLESITIPNSVTSIGGSAFYNCPSLTSITIPNNVTSIGNYAFYKCESLTSITIPNNVISIGGDAFLRCTLLSNIDVSIDNSNYSSKDGVLFNKDRTELIYYPAGKSSSSYTIPNSVTSIGYDAFNSYTSLTSITIPDSVTSIGNGVFCNCTNLESITIPDSVTSIGESAFENCTSLTSITIPNSVTSIGYYAFYDCTSLTSITIPNGITSIGKSTFFGCNKLEDVYYTGTKEEWNKITLGGYNECLTNATIHYKQSDNIMIFGEDNWNFTNSNMYFGMEGSKTYISAKDKYNLLKSLSNTERVRIVKYLNSAWQGSCYGMSITEILAKMGIFNVNSWNSSANSLNELPVLDPEENSAEESLINYYQVLQVTDLIQQEISNTITNYKDEEVVSNLLNMVSEVENGSSPVLVCYSGNGFAHAVVAYGIEDTYKLFNNVRYDKKILIMDSNFGNNYEDEACIYVNTKSNRWCIPHSEYNLNSDDASTRIILATNDLELMNSKGYFKTPDEYLSNNQYISVLEFNYNSNFNISKTIESGSGNWINSTKNGVPEGELFYGFFSNDNSHITTAKTTLKDSLSGYSYSIDKPNQMDLNMSYKNCYLTVSADNSSTVKFAPKGYISMEGKNSDYSMNMIFNEGYYTLPWANIQLDGKNSNNVSMDKVDDGILISGDNLTGVTISAISDLAFTKVSFSTEYDKALAYAIDDYTIGIKVDKDNNGTFETLLTQSNGYNKIKDFSIVGDINNDNKISSMDLLLLKRYILGMKMDISNESQLDINEDSSINLLDLLELKNYIFE